MRMWCHIFSCSTHSNSVFVDRSLEIAPEAGHGVLEPHARDLRLDPPRGDYDWNLDLGPLTRAYRVRIASPDISRHHPVMRSPRIGRSQAGSFGVTETKMIPRKKSRKACDSAVGIASWLTDCRDSDIAEILIARVWRAGARKSYRTQTDRPADEEVNRDHGRKTTFTVVSIPRRGIMIVRRYRPTRTTIARERING